MKNASVDHESAANAAAQSGVEEARGATSSSSMGFTQGGHVGVVVDVDRPLQLFLKPWTQWKAGPALDLMGSCERAVSPIHGSSEANAQRSGCERGGFGQPCGNLAADASRTGLGVNLMAPPPEDRSVSRPRDHLKFCSTDFQAKEWSVHVAI